MTFHLAKGRKGLEQVKSDIWSVGVMGMVENAFLD